MQSPLVQENIPVNLNFKMRFKEKIHNFFKRHIIVQILTYLPSFLVGKFKDLAQLIIKCRRTFAEHSHYVDQMEVKIYGGDKLSTLIQLEKNLKSKPFEQFATVFEFSSQNSLDEAKKMRDQLTDQNERVAILNLANRWQPGGVGLAPYAGSQEEFLVRRSCLAWAFDDHQFESATVHEKMQEVRLSEGYEDKHFDHHIPYFGVVVTKDVTFIDDEEFQQFDIISSAAPDLRPGSDESIYLQQFGEDRDLAKQQIIENKIKAIFDAAISENIDHLILGAFGCGCFKNDTREVAEIFGHVLNLDLYKGRFKNITFAITDEDKLNIFHDVIEEVI